MFWKATFPTGDCFWLNWRIYWQIGGALTYGRIIYTREIFSVLTATIRHATPACAAEILQLHDKVNSLEDEAEIL